MKRLALAALILITNSARADIEVPSEYAKPLTPAQKRTRNRDIIWARQTLTAVSGFKVSTKSGVTNLKPGLKTARAKYPQDPVPVSCRLGHAWLLASLNEADIIVRLKRRNRPTQKNARKLSEMFMKGHDQISNQLQILSIWKAVNP